MPIAHIHGQEDYCATYDGGEAPAHWQDAVGGCWDLNRFQLFILKVGGEIIKHSRRAMLRIAESAQPLWSRLIERLECWRLPDSFLRPTARRRAWMPPPSHSHLHEVLRF